MGIHIFTIASFVEVILGFLFFPNIKKFKLALTVIFANIIGIALIITFFAYPSWDIESALYVLGIQNPISYIFLSLMVSPVKGFIYTLAFKLNLGKTILKSFAMGILSCIFSYIILVFILFFVFPMPSTPAYSTLNQELEYTQF